MLPFDRVRPSADDVIAVFVALSAVAGSYAAVGFTPAFVASPLERFLARRMPGIVVSYAIQYLGSLGQQLNLAAAVAVVVVAFAVIARLAMAVGATQRSGIVATILAGAGVFILGTLVSGSLLSGGGGAVGSVLALGVTTASTAVPTGGETSAGRRRVLASLGTAVGVGGIAAALTSTETDDEAATDPEPGSDVSGIPTDAPGEVRTALQTADDRSLDVAGLEPLVSDDFFNVDINAVDPDIRAESWALSVTGAVEEEVHVNIEDIRAMESRSEFFTLRCVGESLNGTKMDNALWTGVPIMDLVEQANPDSDCECVMLRAADDYFEEFPIDALNGGMLAYEMNGQDLPRGHGYPLRALVPGHWGEINVKWLTEIEVLEREAEGYWEKRGWHGTGPVNTVAKIHAVNDLDDGRTQVGGHTYAGTRGISAVEVSTDGGDTWNEAHLSDPLVDDPVEHDGDPGETPHGADVWRQWAYEYEPPDGTHEVVARAIEADGTVQPKEQSKSYPSGPTGWVSQTIDG